MKERRNPLLLLLLLLLHARRDRGFFIKECVLWSLGHKGAPQFPMARPRLCQRLNYAGPGWGRSHGQRCRLQLGVPNNVLGLQLPPTRLHSYYTHSAPACSSDEPTAAGAMERIYKAWPHLKLRSWAEQRLCCVLKRKIILTPS